jgi:putative permease
MKRLAQITLTIGVTLLGLLLLWVFQPTLALFGGSLAISAALRPLVQRLERRGLGRGMAILIWYLLLLAGITVGVLLYGVGMSTELASAAEQIPRAYATLVQQWQHGSALQQTISRGLPEFDELLQGGASGGGIATLGVTALGFAGGAVSWLIFAFAALSLAYYWLIEAAHFERLWLSLLPVGTRIRAREIWRNAEAAMGAYIRSTVVAIAVSALMLLALYRLSGLPFATMLALIGGISHIVPRLGPALALLPAVVLALATLPLWQAALILVIGGAIQFITHKLAVRAMQNEALKVNPLLQVLVLLALGYVGGLWAMIYAPPLAALIQVLHTSMLLSNTTTRSQESALHLLSERLEQLHASPDAERVELASALRRSNELFKQAEGMLDSN